MSFNLFKCLCPLLLCESYPADNVSLPLNASENSEFLTV